MKVEWVGGVDGAGIVRYTPNHSQDMSREIWTLLQERYRKPIPAIGVRSRSSLVYACIIRNEPRHVLR